MSANRAGGKLTPVTPGHIREYSGRFTGGGAAGNCTAVSGTGYGITAVNYNAATGLYQIVLADSFQTLDSYSFATQAAGTATTMKVASVVAFNAAAGTINISVVDLAATPALEDIATNEELCVIIRVRNEGVYT